MSLPTVFVMRFVYQFTCLLLFGVCVELHVAIHIRSSLGTSFMWPVQLCVDYISTYMPYLSLVCNNKSIFVEVDGCSLNDDLIELLC